VDAPAKELRTRDLVPFARAAASGVAAVMTAHVAYPALDPDSSPDLPATLSTRILSGILREELGFRGLVLSDALIMEGIRRPGGEGQAAVEAMAAGCDVLLCPTDHREVVAAVAKAVEEGRLAEKAVESSLDRLEEAVKALRRRPTARELGGMDEYRVYAMAKASVTAVRDRGGILPLRPLAGSEVLAVVLDDDDRAGREAPVLERKEEFGLGVLRRTPKSAETAEVAGRAAVAERVFLFCYGDTRAWKGRSGLAPELLAVRRAVEEKAGDRTVLVGFGSPALLEGEGSAAAVCAWDDAPLVQRAAIDLLLSGRAPTGRPPWGPDPLG
jgi:beta-glucosidase-like glycosyl hydrolase